MRSVFIHLINTDKLTVSKVLDDKYVRNNDDPIQWLVLSENDSILYIEYYSEYQEYEPVEWRYLIKRLGGKPSVTIVADVSGRYHGRTEVIKLVSKLLESFEGVAQDDSEGIWSLEEIARNEKQEGNTFFPYQKYC